MTALPFDLEAEIRALRTRDQVEAQARQIAQQTEERIRLDGERKTFALKAREAFGDLVDALQMCLVTQNRELHAAFTIDTIPFRLYYSPQRGQAPWGVDAFQPGTDGAYLATGRLRAEGAQEGLIRFLGEARDRWMSYQA